MKEYLFFSNNKNKIIEAANIFKNSNIKILNLDKKNNSFEPKETGSTFEENAKIKSLYGFSSFNKICFADDSGICISAIGGKPGVESKKYLAKEKYKVNVFNKIINTAKNKGDFSAFFQTTICLSLNKDVHLFFTGKIQGKISSEIKGVGGFGYDPIFIPKGNKLTFAQMNINEKNKISHRGIALKKLKKYLCSI